MPPLESDIEPLLHRSSSFHRAALRALCLAGLALAPLAGLGCDDDAVCPSGTAGNPCRYTATVSQAPTVPSRPDASAADATSIDIDDDSADPSDIDGELPLDGSDADTP